MTSKADFNAEEWSTVTGAPALAAIAVAAADRGGTLREGLSMARTYQEARAAHPSPLLEAVLASPPTLDRSVAQDAAGVATRAEAEVRAASDVLRERATPEELREYGDFVIAVLDAVARAHKEGSVLGVGGKEVSGRERAVMDAVALALGERPGG